MAVAYRDTRAGTASAAQAARPVSKPRPGAPSDGPAPAVQATPTADQAVPRRPTRQRDYDAPASPWPLFLYLLLVILVVNVAFVWAAVRAAGA